MKGKVAVVTASSTGIGKGIVEELASNGCSVVVSSRNKDHIQQTVKELQSKGYQAHGIVCHVGKKQDRQSLIKQTIQRFGRIDYLVCNAAVSTSFGNFFDAKQQQIKKMWDINFHSVFELVKETLPQLRKQKNSSIIIISSYAGYEYSKVLGHYGITKTALFALTKALANQLLDDGIRVNAIAPGIIKTKFSGIIWQKDQKGAEDIMGVKRLGIPQDIAKTARFLLSQDAGYITGEVVAVAGRPISRL